MILKRILGENVSNYDKISYDFSTGLTIINGDNHSGKSSIIDLIRFSLYGNCTKSKKIEYFKKRGSKGNLTTEIEFEYNGNTWIINRLYGKKEKIAKIIINGEEKAVGIDNANTYLAENFVNESLLLNSNLCQQKDSTGLLEVRDTERFNITKKIFDLDEYKKKADLVKLDIEKIQVELVKTQQLVSIYKKDVEDTEEKLKQLDIEFIKNNIEVLNTEMVSLNKEKETKIEEKFSLESELKDIEKINAETRNKEKEYQELEKALEGNKSLKEKAMQKVKEVNLNLFSLREKQAVLVEDIKNLEIKISGSILPRIKKFNMDSILEVNTELSVFREKEKDINSRIEFVNKKICPTCGQNINNINIKELEGELSEVKGHIIEFTKKLEDLKLEKLDIETKEKEANELKEKKSKLVSEVSTKQLILSKNEELLISYKENSANLEKSLEEYNALIETTEKKKDSFIIPKALDLSEINNKITNNRKDLEKLNLTLEAKRGELKNLESLKSTYSFNTDKIKGLKDKIRIEEGNTVITTDLINNLTEVRAIFEKKLPLYVVLNKLSFISVKSNEFLHKIFDKYDVSFEQNKDALSIIFKDTVTNLPSDYSNLSGFESTLGGLAIRMGFSIYNSVFNKDAINLVILDEVDASFTDKNSELLYKSIFNLKNMFKQIIMVTHKSEVKEFLAPDDIINVKNNGINSFIVKE